MEEWREEMRKEEGLGGEREGGSCLLLQQVKPESKANKMP